MPFLFEVHCGNFYQEGSASCTGSSISFITSNSATCHLHLVESAHALSFRPNDPETKEAFFKLFEKGHNAASAYHWHETKLFLDGEEDQHILADRAMNQTKPDVTKLYEEWRQKSMGPDNGRELFTKLEVEVKAYNEMKCDGQSSRYSNLVSVLMIVTAVILNL